MRFDQRGTYNPRLLQTGDSMKRKKESRPRLFRPAEILFSRPPSLTLIPKNDDVKTHVHFCSPMPIPGDEMMTFVETKKKNGTTAAADGLKYFICE
jgi:hypothetical protein